MLLLAGCALAPFASQRPKPLPKVGVLCSSALSATKAPVAARASNAAAFVDELRALGHVDGETVTLVWRGRAG